MTDYNRGIDRRLFEWGLDKLLSGPPRRIDVGHKQSAIEDKKQATNQQRQEVEVNHDGATAASSGSTDEPNMEGVDDGDFYCSTEDFPCEGGVYICLYSTFRGYQTLCVPEAKSDILAYYDQSYCGECVGWRDALRKLF